jgi:hypothetical protein
VHRDPVNGLAIRALLHPLRRRFQVECPAGRHRRSADAPYRLDRTRGIAADGHEGRRGLDGCAAPDPEPPPTIRVYASLQQLFRFFATWDVLEWNDAAVDEFDALRRAKIRVGTLDLKIASICRANNATLLTRNAKDFSKVPGLQIQDWLS